MELVASSSEDGAKNALRNKVSNIEFVNSKVEDFVEKCAEENKLAGQKTTIILDPPRDGLHPSAIPHILAFGAEEIIYVSCNPGTLVRDVAQMVGFKGFRTDDEDEEADEPKKKEKEALKPTHTYRITDITAVDMFPHTHHIETVVRLERIR